MTNSEKIACIKDYMNQHWGQEVAETLWYRSCKCTTEEELAALYDEFLA